MPRKPKPCIFNVEPEDFSTEARAILRSAGNLQERPLNRKGLIRCIGDVDVLITRLGHRIDAEILRAGRNLRAIATATTGLDHIDLACARERGITVLSLKGETRFLRTIPASAELTWGLLLALMRRIPFAWADVRAGRWDRDAFLGHDLMGKRLGIVGVGRIGEKVARYARAFGMQVVGFDPQRRRFPAGVTRCASLDALLRRSDVLSLHVPLAPETTGLIDAGRLNRLPAGAVLINTARGPVIDESALLRALQSGALAGAALDVICGETESGTLRRSPLLRYARTHGNVIVTPHIGGCTIESRAMTEVFMARKVKRFLDGKRLGAASPSSIRHGGRASREPSLLR